MKNIIHIFKKIIMFCIFNVIKNGNKMNIIYYGHNMIFIFYVISPLIAGTYYYINWSNLIYSLF